MNESAKARSWWGELEFSVICGKGIDIGCGPDPVTPNCAKFDQEDGDANVISQIISEVFDFVYSSHCLEHMRDPQKALQEWWKLVKPGGYLFVTVPDEDLYEQGVFPNRFNDDHKATFTISKSKSWSPMSYNVLGLGRSLSGGEIISLCLQDRLYDRVLMGSGKHIPPFFIRIFGFFCKFRLISCFFQKSVFLNRALSFYFPVDQTAPPFNAQAQIQLIVRKQVAT
jgi:SAM-dependent methyltransferase